MKSVAGHTPRCRDAENGIQWNADRRNDNRKKDAVACVGITESLEEGGTSFREGFLKNHDKWKKEKQEKKDPCRADEQGTDGEAISRSADGVVLIDGD
jgi:hypothetical protein